ncbi:hypothetical protein [Thalassolituus sp.]|jgi:hypothetical protein|uniref:hypothetical protein n=1 Tax=Thalassolituus sp. TaxID=2030822 RepID=UPI003512BD04|nr:MAG: hypothetical protein CSH36_08140 [Thalassolituus sp.]
MTERFPDLEIYLLKPDIKAVGEWLISLFSDLEALVHSESRCHWRAGTMDIFLNDKAEKNFASLWFRSNNTAWNNDLELGRAAFAALGCEVRCSDSSWQEGEEESPDEGWVKINRNGEKPCHW